jgi:hypothetical protein
MGSIKKSFSSRFLTWIYVPLGTALLTMVNCAQVRSSSISAVWANDGTDKVTQDEVRASRHPLDVLNSIWNGTAISVFGARNEIVSFNLILEATAISAFKVTVTLSDLRGPADCVIRYLPRDRNDFFDWTGTESELFYVRYLKIEGLSEIGYGTLAPWQEPTFPKRARCPSGAGCSWDARVVANKFYPDIAVPIELEPAFSIAAPGNQAIWADIYIPKTMASGLYTGTVTISENGIVAHYGADQR